MGSAVSLQRILVSSLIVKEATYQTGASATGATVMPYDDSPPQSGEGNQYMSLDFKPTNVNNKILILVKAMVSMSSGGIATLALFKDSDTTCLASISDKMEHNIADVPRIVDLLYEMPSAGTTSTITFKVRIGPDGAYTVTFNGSSSSRRLGGYCVSSIKIFEIKK